MLFYKKILTRKNKKGHGEEMKFTDKELNEVLVQVEEEETLDYLENVNYQDYLQTKYWQTVRHAMHDIVGHKCEICGSELFINVHHFSYENRGKETLNDLACLCQRCHEVIHCINDNFTVNIYNRVEFERLLELGNSIKEDFDNKRYIKVLPLSRTGTVTNIQLQKLFDYSKKQVDKYLHDEIKCKLVSTMEFTTEGKTKKYYSLNKFLWFLIELDFPKVGD